MNWIPIGLTIFLLIFVGGTVFWLMSTLGPIRRKQAQRKLEREEALRRESDAS